MMLLAVVKTNKQSVLYILTNNFNFLDCAGPNVNISSFAFKMDTFKKSVYLSHNNRKILIEPSDSLIEVLFKHVLSTGTEPWKNINDLWAVSVKILVEDPSTVNMEVDALASGPVDPIGDERIKLALDLLAELPIKVSNDQLSSKMAKELDSPLLVALNAISSHWIRSAQAYPFLYPFALRVSLMRTVCVGRLRALLLLQQRIAPATGDVFNDLITSTISLPRKRFRIHRKQLLKCLRHVFTPGNCGDLRLFEFEYANELGTGHGPTMEFYALASIELCRPSLGLFHVTRPGNFEADEMIEAEGEGLFPSWKRDGNSLEFRSDFRLLGAVVARAWLDERIVDLPFHPLFIKALQGSLSRVEFSDLNMIDSELYETLYDDDKMIGTGISFTIPGTDIHLVAGDGLIGDKDDIFEYRKLLMERISLNLINARDSFLQGFNETFPRSFDELARFFPTDLINLFSPSAASLDDWSIDYISEALVPDHGYRHDSPQIQWLAEILSETACDSLKRSKIVRFLTGAAYLPVGGWKSLRPRLTIVCKTFSGSSSLSRSSSSRDGTNSNSNSEVIISPTTEIGIITAGESTDDMADSTLVPLSISPSTSTSSAENHDAYLPSVMTCANYLKLPRYTSKEIMRERIWYAVTEGSGSFHLS